MKKMLFLMLSVYTFFGGVVASRAGTAGTPGKSWNFSTDRAGAPPAGFEFARTGNGRPGRWLVVPAAQMGEPGNVLAQTDADTTDNRFPIAIAESPVLRDLRLSASCAPVAGKVDRACGIVFRYRDENNYYVARANALEDNVRLYRVKNGRREQIASWDGKVASGTWHAIQADVRGDRLEIHWDGRKVIEARDGTFPDAGRVGVWTKADSVTYFRELRAETIGP